MGRTLVVGVTERWCAATDLIVTPRLLPLIDVVSVPGLDYLVDTQTIRTLFEELRLDESFDDDLVGRPIGEFDHVLQYDGVWDGYAASYGILLKIDAEAARDFADYNTVNEYRPGETLRRPYAETYGFEPFEK